LKYRINSQKGSEPSWLETRVLKAKKIEINYEVVIYHRTDNSSFL
jgi:hypothetical protein